LDKALGMLEAGLSDGQGRKLDPVVQARLAAAVQQDIQDLRPHLDAQGQAREAQARSRLAQRAEVEAKAMAEILLQQKQRISATQKREDRDLLGVEQSLFPAMQKQLEEDLRQLQSNRKHWQKRLAAIDEERKTEPARIRALYEVQASRIEPVGLVYLYPQIG
jgi:hypothetical protein